ncbi:MAG: Hsp70 family protein [Proteobacteria bacterium]|nr:Hsp70 family protein [Pseudomonadota bacterium]
MSAAGEPVSPRFGVGIDLGTTHCALCFVPFEQAEAAGTRTGETLDHQDLAIAQMVAPGEVERRPLLPSFAYLPHGAEFRDADLQLPWPSKAGAPLVGELARRAGASTPMRLIASAKSWLCHPGVDRQAAILPIEAPEDVPRLSPVQASVRYLEHLKAAWELEHPDAPLGQQDVTITIPASFDPAARELTAAAAKRAGCERLTLLEEPQAAVYSWIVGSRGRWRDKVQVGDVVLVVDVGGGTTDLSLIAVRQDAGALELHRVAVGDHILLGGDNMDLALAHAVRAKLQAKGKRLDPWQMRALTHACRAAKETLLSDASVESVPVVVPARGSKLVGGAVRSELTRAEVTSVLVEGFFPDVGSDARPRHRTRAAFTELGLPYAQDPAITRHLAAFLARQAGALEPELADAGAPPGEASARFAKPTAILVNGGVFRAPLLLERTTNVLNGWLRAAGAQPARVLEGASLDLACARGAAYHCHARRGRGIRIRGGTAKAFYVGVEAAMPAVPGIPPQLSALCVAPFGLEEGSAADALEREFGLVVGEPVRLPFFGSSVRRQDTVGSALEHWDEQELEELEELEVELSPEGRRRGEIVPVRLQARVTEVGTLELLALPRAEGEPWRVEFDLRAKRPT